MLQVTNTVDLEKLTVFQPVEKLSAFYEIRKFITVSTRARPWFLS